MRLVDRLLQRWRESVAMRWIPRGARILDVGCHQGEFLRRLGRNLGSGVGLDPHATPISEPQLTLIRDLFPPASPLPPASFDVVVMLATLEHIRDKDRLAEECFRLLRPGGRVVITVPSRFVDPIVALLTRLRLADGMSLDEHHGFDPLDTPTVFARHGFSLLQWSTFQFGLNHLFVLTKPAVPKSDVHERPTPERNLVLGGHPTGNGALAPRAKAPAKPLRVTVVSHYALPHIGGIEVVVDREVRALRESGCRVTLVTTDIGGPGGTPQYAEGVQVERLPAWNGLERRLGIPYPFVLPSHIPRLMSLVRECDVLHVHGAIYQLSVLAILLGKAMGKRVILTEHCGPQPHASRVATAVARLGFETLGRVTTQLSDRVTSVNGRVTTFLERLARTRRKSLFLPNPIDLSQFHRRSPEERRAARAKLGWGDDRPKVLFVGRLTSDKGADHLLATADPRFDLVFLGPGDPATLGPLPRPGVVYLPPRPPAQVVDVYHAADVLVLPSLREGFPLVVQEALACGLKVVTTYDPGYLPYLPIPGLLFCGREPEAISGAIRASLVGDGPSTPLAGTLLALTPQDWVARLLGPEIPPDYAATPAGKCACGANSALELASTVDM
jgi:glycosyltransferase involved in cell wall biosynthesis/SAM-dependent methyltransferase